MRRLSRYYTPPLPVLKEPKERESPPGDRPRTLTLSVHVKRARVCSCRARISRKSAVIRSHASRNKIKKKKTRVRACVRACVCQGIGDGTRRLFMSSSCLARQRRCVATRKDKALYLDGSWWRDAACCECREAVVIAEGRVEVRKSTYRVRLVLHSIAGWSRG